MTELYIKPGRHTGVAGKKAFAYGIDHAVGIFLQVWDIDPNKPLTHIDNILDGSNEILDEDQMFHELNLTRMNELAKIHQLDVTFLYGNNEE